MPTNLSRSLLAVLVPGLIAVAPWLLALVQHTSATLGFGSHPTIAHALFFAAAAVAGTLCEAAGSFLEVAWDNEREATHNVKENWYSYLSRSFEKEPVGYRYISRLVTGMYFELAMLFAVPSFLAGAAFLASLRFPDHSLVFALLALVSCATAVWYFLWQAKCTHLVICETRAQLVKRLPAN